MIAEVMIADGGPMKIFFMDAYSVADCGVLKLVVRKNQAKILIRRIEPFCTRNRLSIEFI